MERSSDAGAEWDLVIFDCDGVLVNTEEIGVEIELAMLAERGVAMDRDAFVARYLGLAWDEYERRLRAAVIAEGADPLEPDFLAALHARLHEATQARLAALPGAEAAIRALRGAKCVASSSTADKLVWKLERVGLATHFAPHIFSTDLVEHGKPAPDLFLHAAAAMNARPARAAVIEDSVNGVRAAKAAGMTAIGLVAGGHCPPGHGATLKAAGADIVIARFEELPGALAQSL